MKNLEQQLINGEHYESQKFNSSIFSLRPILFNSGDGPEKEKCDVKKAQNTITQFKKVDSGLDSFFENSFGYAVSPSIGKGAIVIGGADGKGVVFKQSDMIAGSNMTQITVGFPLGGQQYIEVIFFETADSFKRYINNK